MDLGMHGLTRLDQPKKYTHGWQLRLTKDGTSTTTWFADKDHGGREGSLKAAQHYRDVLVKALKIDVAKQEFRHLKSGRVGVRHSTRKTENGVYRYWIAIDPETGKSAKRFSVQTMGEEKAKAAAIALRVELEGGR